MASKSNSGSPARGRFTPNEKPIEINGLAVKKGDLPPAHQPAAQVARQASVNGIEMGVLADGTPYLSEFGLAQFCGLDHSSLNELSLNWEHERLKPRGRQIEVLLGRLGHSEPNLYRKVEINGKVINAYLESACMAILEYYAFHPREPRQRAIDNFRTLARHKFRDYIYEAVGYKPVSRDRDTWRQFLDRIDLTKNAVDVGYFGVFHESAPMMVPLLSEGVELGPKVVIDISVGRAWSNYWVENKLDEKYGDRKRYDHNYPDYFPQARSNPQECFAYPDAALGEFRRWLRETYMVKQLPSYLTTQVKANKISFSAAVSATTALTQGRKPPERRLGT